MSYLEALGKSLNKSIRHLLRLPIIDEKAVKALVKELQRTLLQSDVNVNIVLKISENITERALKEKLPPGVSRKEHIIKVLYEELVKYLGEKPVRTLIPQKKPYILMLVGIQGSGKTVGAVKIARFFQKRGLKTALICADTFRPGAYEQISQLASKISIPVFHNENEKKVEQLVSIGVKNFIEGSYDVIIIDTAGRHKNEKDLMSEIKRMEVYVKPDESMLVIDGTIGQQASSHAKAFQETTKIGSIYVTKLDGSARGGGALSAVASTNARIKFIGTGEGIEDIEVFDPPKFVGRLLGMGDLETLLEKVKDAEIELSETKAMKLLGGKFTLSDLFQQMEALRKMGPLKKILNMIPGGSNIPDDQFQIAEKKLNDWKAILQSMRKEEIEDPKIIDSSRARRIARGSGKTEKAVKELISQYFSMKRMFKTFKRRQGVLSKRLQFLNKEIKTY